MKAKKIFIVISFSALLISMIWSEAKAQNRPLLQRPRVTFRRGYSIDTIQRNSVLTFYPTNFFASTLKLGYEFKTGNKTSLKLLASFGSSNNGNFYSIDKFSEFSLEAQYRFYVLKGHLTLNGLYLAPYAGFKSMTYSGDSTNYNYYYGYPYTGAHYVNNATVSDFSVGYVVGYQWIFHSTFTIDAFIGGGDNFISGNSGGGDLSNSYYAYRSGIDLHTGVAIGLAF